MSRYEQIAAVLRERILAGQYAPGQRLPRQRDLADAWKTTLPTVRQALDQLQDEGLLRVTHGVGTFVADLDAAHDPLALESFSDVLRERGLSVETQLLSVEARATSSEAAEALGATAREGLVAITRLRLLGGVPIVHQTSYLIGRHRAKLRRYRGVPSLYAFLRQRLGLHAMAYRETLAAEAARPTLAAALQLPTGTPIIVARRTTATAGGTPFLYDEAALASGRIQITLTRYGARSVVELSPTDASGVR